MNQLPRTARIVATANPVDMLFLCMSALMVDASVRTATTRSEGIAQEVRND